jgi:predicted GNAT family N-acyltransferase
MIIVRQEKDQRVIANALSIRQTVFVEEQGVPKEIEFDGNDDKAIHVIAYKDDIPIGCARLLNMQSGAKIGRVAVLKAYRKQGIGEAICTELINIARQMGISYVYLHAQVSAKPFYEKIGFITVGDSFYEADILHYKMEKNINDHLAEDKDE